MESNTRGAAAAAGGERVPRTVTRVGAFAISAFLKIELFFYVLIGLMLAVAALIGLISAGASLWTTVQLHGAQGSVLFAIDRLLFVLMIVEILHTVRVSFRAGSMVCEPFLVVGLIASIRRVLVITLESSQAEAQGQWTPNTSDFLHSSMLELIVLGGLILIMVASIIMLRRSARA
jgi:phosphate starvation-inducible membrane PsiE